MIPPRCANIPAAGVFIALLILLSVVPARAITPVQAERGHAISLRLKCMCGGCEDTVGTCNHSGGAFAGPCATAKSMLKEIDQRVARGESDDLILQDFVQEYGPTVLVSPPAKGFDWLVWAMPIILPLLAFVLVWQVVVRWRRHTATEPAAAAGPPVSAELLARARREAGGGADE
ncbi:MAG: cytochrome c-type biogenesis protein CcmH [Acidobacteriota bacterium]|nr:cytochrome c-type biogenesis protein CcmH [Acidobacteriota bacterium]MDE3169399.1 cytochrome c-type biogenesis protein CcmH [Acidobacteriota bacterium]